MGVMSLLHFKARRGGWVSFGAEAGVAVREGKGTMHCFLSLPEIYPLGWLLVLGMSWNGSWEVTSPAEEQWC